MVLDCVFEPEFFLLIEIKFLKKLLRKVKKNLAVFYIIPGVNENKKNLNRRPVLQRFLHTSTCSQESHVQHEPTQEVLFGRSLLTTAQSVIQKIKILMVSAALLNLIATPSPSLSLNLLKSLVRTCVQRLRLSLICKVCTRVCVPFQ